VHLSDRGREQAERLGERLRPVPLAALYASPLERCVETAAPIAAGRKLDLRPAPELQDTDHGRWTGRSLAWFNRTKRWAAAQRSPGSFRFPDGESLAEAQRRTVDALDRIAASHPRGIVAVVTHADMIRMALAHYSGMHLDLFERLVVSPASVSVVAVGDGMPRIVRMNDTGSLADLIPSRPRRPASRNGQRPAPRPARRGGA